MIYISVENDLKIYLTDTSTALRLDVEPTDSIFQQMRPIPPPPTGVHPDRFLRCQEAMADAMANVATSAIAAGWRPDEVAAALVELADHIMLAIIANRSVELDLAHLRKK